MFLSSEWVNHPTASETETWALERVNFPTVTLCPGEENNDRWGPTIKIFDHLNRTCPEK